MFDFIMANISTIVVGAAVALLIAAVTAKLIKDKKNHKSSCGCSCAGCPGAGICHTE